MPNTFATPSKCLTPILLTAALAVPFDRMQAQPTELANGAARYDVACSIQDSSGPRSCAVPSSSSCDAESYDASLPSPQSTGITFINRGDSPVKVYWLNFQGNRVLYQSLPPGGRYTQPTFYGHNWLVATMSEQCLGVFKTSPESIEAGSASFPPPPIPDYEQSPPPEENLIWTPGYWAWNQDIGNYYWVDDAWIAAPIVGYLWTPGYWAVQHGAFAWRPGYWGPHVGFYGGINYGYGYFGRGFVGGSWRNGRMMYNSAVINVGRFHLTNTYDEPVPHAATITRVSYTGGGGISARPNAAELAAATEIHIPSTAAQSRQLHAAQNNPATRSGINNGASRTQDQHSGSLSFVHSTAPPARPARAADAVAPYRASSAAPTGPAVRPQNQPRATQPQTSVARAPAEQQPAPHEGQQPHQNPSQTRPRPVTHTDGHLP
jgi:VHL beta domain/WXXGXW repeat (2 copies)